MGWEAFGNPVDALATDQWQHGFAYVYTRAAWEKYPFPDKETVGTGSQDLCFMTSLRHDKVPARLVHPGGSESIAACGWHRDATCGSKDVSANVNTALVLEFIINRGDEVHSIPKPFVGLMPSLKEVASTLLNRRENYLRELVDEHGSVYVCAHCNFAVAQSKYLTNELRPIKTRMYEVDADTMTRTLDKVSMSFEIAQFSRAGGCMGEGHWSEP